MFDSAGKRPQAAPSSHELRFKIARRDPLYEFVQRAGGAADGAEAVAIYAQKRNEIAVVLIDMAMPIMDGMTTIRVLHKMNPALKIIAASGLRTHSSGAIETNSEIKYFLDKPYTAGMLLKTLQTILGEKPTAI